MGFTAAVNDMLLLCEKDGLRILPALPKAWSTGSVTGLGAVDGQTVDLHWDPETITLRMTSVKARSTRLLFPCSVSFEGKTGTAHTVELPAETPVSLTFTIV